MLPLKERIALIPGIQAAYVGDLGYNGALGEIVNGEYDSYSFESGDESLMDVTGYTLLQGLPWKEAIEQYPNPAYLNRTWAQSLFPNGEIPFGHTITEYEPRLKVGSHIKEDHVIVGVVEDYAKYYIDALEKPIDKAIITYANDGIYLIVRIDPKQSSGIIEQINEEWDKLHPGVYLYHRGLHELLLSRNTKVIQLSDLLLMYSIISILLTCFGLFGIALYATEQRTKEIGIRKVNGSSTWQIMQLLNRQFINWIGIAFLIAVPIIWWIIRRWMESFVYRADFSIWIYVLSLLIVIAITLLTVSWHSYKAASGNPVKALQSE